MLLNERTGEMVKMVNGRAIARKSNDSVKEKIAGIVSGGGGPLKLVSVSVGSNEGARIYMAMQKRAAEYVGIDFETIELPGATSQEELFALINELNGDRGVTAMIVQSPVPARIDHNRAVAAVAPFKDAEGIHPYNLGKILRMEADIVPCTPGAVMKILRNIGCELYGKEVVIIGHSAIVGKPLSLMMLNENATTTVCHLATSEKGDIISHSRKADILVVAAGAAGLVKSGWIKEGAVVVDVGINKVDGGVVGDVDPRAASEKASYLTPVPGGVGPVTVSILMRNVLRAYLEQKG
ncbi:MAG: bifunctional 5,10-methylenetetrahydrofolate dehydrogenase/5,10-methenyltetrahydrofolate cyclohydrolase [Candidatus Omnitrophica bacterium]|nr:bifunctional 5,10-methylenetetrahydrofolate dehydrogenase/5,10-methenyltetrahydrofolate cyclohydrolase [Candidatus Omnitrophota bacterium]